MKNILKWFGLILLFCSCNSNHDTIEVRNKEGLLLEFFTRNQDNLQKDGYYAFFFSNGNISEEGWYKNDTLHGQRIRYFENKKVKIVEYFNKGKLSGDYRAYYAGGGLMCDYEFKNGKAEGLWKNYYHNGRLKEVLTYKNDRPNGLYLEYYTNGKTKAKGNYMNGANRHGLLKIYNVNGRLVKEMICAYGDCQTIWREKNSAAVEL